MHPAYPRSRRAATGRLIGYRPGMPPTDLNALDLQRLFTTLVEGPSFDSFLELALHEDLDEAGDLTTNAMVDPSRVVDAAVVSRSPGVLAG
ncbi:MAG: hypothetical protein VXX30_08700, partial [Planctomycetota bacterium]|nr:hypothetical protein [Planctomycetota bacterium]